MCLRLLAFGAKLISNAGIAQLVERNLAKVEVTSSNLVCRSILKVKHEEHSGRVQPLPRLRSRLSLEDRESRVSLQFNRFIDLNNASGRGMEQLGSSSGS